MKREAMRLILVLLAACACPPKKTGPTIGAGSGSQGSAAGTSCDSVKSKVEGLYRAEAQEREPKRVDEYVADNTTMVMADCAKAPDRAVACITAAQSVKDLETRCLVPIDDEGTEGERRK